MQCYTPMVRYYQKVNKEDPEDKLVQKIIPRSQVFSNMEKDENYLTRIQDLNYKLEESGSNWRYQLIPCRHCFACKLKYSAEWATRLTYEAQRYDHKYFITLTYDEEHLPMYSSMIYTDPEGNKTTYENDGTWTGTLEPKDATRFINTLKRYYNRKEINDIKYFYCGEYGDLGRPHYHLILFGAPLDIKQFYDFKLDQQHKKFHWKSKELDSWWGKGFVDVAEVEWNSCAYVARYCMKKIDNDNDKRKYAEVGKMPEYIRMSRNPGIGNRYYEEHKKEIYELDEIYQINYTGNVNAFKPPKAWDRKFKDEFPEEWENIHKSREACAERNRLLTKEIQKGITDYERLENEAIKTIRKGNMLKRLIE